MIETGRTYNEDCVKTMARMDDESIDMVLTSPPYDDLRSYGDDGFVFDFDRISSELHRILKPGCVLVWVVGGDKTFSSLMNAKALLVNG